MDANQELIKHEKRPSTDRSVVLWLLLLQSEKSSKCLLALPNLLRHKQLIGCGIFLFFFAI